MRCNIPSRDLSQKIGNTVCMYGNEPVFVEVLGRGNNIRIYFLGKENQFKEITTDDENFDISSPPLGYMKDRGNRVFYLTRSPVRRSRQGLDHRSLKARRIPILDNNGQKISLDPYGVNDVFHDPGFYNMVTNRYPPVDLAIDNLVRQHKENPEKHYEEAISRQFGLTINQVGIINVFLKNELVGWIPPNSLTVQVPSSEKGWVISKYLSHILGWEIN